MILAPNRIISCALSGFLCLIFCVCASAASTGEIPDVHTAFFRLNRGTYELIGAYSQMAPYRPTMGQYMDRKEGNFYYDSEPPSDIGYNKIISKLTSETLFHMATVWCAASHIIFPPLGSFSEPARLNYAAQEPARIVSFFAIPDSVRADIWNAIKKLEPLTRVAEQGYYELLIHKFAIESIFGELESSEWLVVAQGISSEFKDLGIIEVKWPKTCIMKDLITIPKITLHNFGLQNETFSCALTVSNSTELVYESTSEPATLSPDSILSITFDPFLPNSEDNLRFIYNLRGFGQTIWTDDYSINNMLDTAIQVTAEPVFQRYHQYPQNAAPFDFDGDGDIDFFVYGVQPKLLRNDGNENLADITEYLNVSILMHPRLALCNDLNNDGFSDILICYFYEPTILLAGDGAGGFRDFSHESGIIDYSGNGQALVLDIENDGDRDILFPAEGRSIVLLNDGFGRFTDYSDAAGLDHFAQTEHIAAGDLNNDGFDDLVMTNWEEYSRIFMNDGSGKFHSGQSFKEIIYGRMAHIFDYDNDGRNDILFLQQLYDYHSELYRNMGDDRFERSTKITGEFGPAFHVDAADINADGYIDLILGQLRNYDKDMIPVLRWDSPKLLLNQGGVFHDGTELLVDLHYYGLPNARFLDIEGDGDLDIYAEDTVFLNMALDPQGLTAVSHPRSNIPEGFSLSQNYPNPFNPATTIKYSLPYSARISIVIYSILGQETKVLIHDLKSAGNHQIIWDGTNSNGNPVSSGLYLYRLETEGYSETKKMLLLR